MKRRAFIKSRNKIRSWAVLPQPKEQSPVKSTPPVKPGHRRFSSDPTILRKNSVPVYSSLFTPSKKQLVQKSKIDTGLQDLETKTYERMTPIKSTKQFAKTQQFSQPKEILHSQFTSNGSKNSKIGRLPSRVILPKIDMLSTQDSTHSRLLTQTSPQNGNSQLKKYNQAKNTVQELPKVVQKFAYKTQTGEVQGRTKPHNQDAYIIIPNFGGTKNQFFFSVCDGHGLYGHEVSAYLKKNLPKYILKEIPKGIPLNPSLEAEDVQKFCSVLKIAAKKIDKDLTRLQRIDTIFSGTTCVQVMLRGDLLLCANTGDSRAVIGRQQSNGNWKAIPLSEDHKPDNPLERQRIESNGGMVEAFKGPGNEDIGPARVWIRGSNPPIPGLAMSRSFGDNAAQSVGVTAEPEIMQHRLTPEDKFLVLASDGIFEFITNEACVQKVSTQWPGGSLETAWDTLVRDATRYWHAEDEVVDDITVIIVYLNIS